MDLDKQQDFKSFDELNKKTYEIVIFEIMDDKKEVDFVILVANTNQIVVINLK